MTLPRGIRNDNPGNIRRTATTWVGQSVEQPDKSFVCFDTPESGLRALMKVLLSYQRRYKIHTIEAIISRWAPPVENNTDAYVAAVAKHVGVAPKAFVDVEVPDNLIRLAQAITQHENGKGPAEALPWWYSDTVYERAAEMALGRSIALVV